MILQRLVQYYDRLAQEPAARGDLPVQGYSLQKVSFCIVLDAMGRLRQFQSLLDEGSRAPRPRQLLVPGQSKPSGSGINPGFLWDNAAYMLGIKPSDAKPQRTRASFEAFRDRHVALESTIASPAFRAVCEFLRRWDPDAAGQWMSELADITGSFGVFRLAEAQHYVHDDPIVVRYWAAQSDGGSNGPVGMSLVSGRHDRIARLHEPKIKGVRGAQTSGALLVSFNDDAYTSLGRVQGDNAPVSSEEAFKYANALNRLLASDRRRMLLGDMTVVFWAERPNPLENFVSDLFGDASPGESAEQSAEDRRQVEQVRLFLSQLRDGYRGAGPGEPDDAVPFFVLGLSPNASRIAVRLWMATSVGELKATLALHLRDIALTDGNAEPLVLRRLIQATGRAIVEPHGRVKYDADSCPPLLAGAVARAVLTGGPYPQSLLTAMLGRIRADGVVSHARVAGIKGCLVRNSRLRGNPLEVAVGLDTTKTDPAYVTGRLFALLEKAQEDSSDSDLNATIKDRYFSSASATPAVVFPRLIRLNAHHLAKLETPKKIFYEKQLGEIMSKIDGFAQHFTLEDQGLFAVGYFHQRQDLFTKKPREGDAS